MKILASILFILLSLPAFAQPIVHVGEDINFYGTYGGYEAGNYNGYGGVLVSYDSAVNVDPVNGSAAWTSWYDVPANLWSEDYFDVDAFANSVSWGLASYIPTGYETFDAQWYLCHHTSICNSTFSIEFTGCEIYPTNSGNVWIDWDVSATPRITWSENEPVDWCKYLSDGSINPNYVEPVAPLVKRGKGHKK